LANRLLRSWIVNPEITYSLSKFWNNLRKASRESFEKLSRQKRNYLIAFKTLFKKLKKSRRSYLLTIDSLEGILTNLGFKIKHFATYLKLLRHWQDNTGIDIIKEIGLYNQIEPENISKSAQSFIENLGSKISILTIPNKKRHPWSIQQYLTNIVNLVNDSKRSETAILKNKLTKILTGKLKGGRIFQYKQLNEKYSIELLATRVPKMDEDLINNLSQEERKKFPSVTEKESKPFIMIKIKRITRKKGSKPAGYLVLYPTIEGTRLLESTNRQFPPESRDIYKNLADLLKEYVKPKDIQIKRFHKSTFNQLLKYLAGYYFVSYLARYNNRFEAFSKTLKFLQRKDHNLTPNGLENFLVSLKYPLLHISSCYNLNQYYQAKKINIRKRYKELLNKEGSVLKAFSRLFEELKTHDCNLINGEYLERLLITDGHPIMYITQAYKIYQYYLDNKINIESLYRRKYLEQKHDELNSFLALSQELKKTIPYLNHYDLTNILKWLDFPVSYTTYSYMLKDHYETNKINLGKELEILLDEKRSPLLAFGELFKKLQKNHPYTYLSKKHLEGALRILGYSIQEIAQYYKLYEYYLNKKEDSINIETHYEKILTQTQDSYIALLLLFQKLQKIPGYTPKSLTLNNLKGALINLGIEIKYFDTYISLFRYWENKNIDVNFDNFQKVLTDLKMTIKEFSNYIQLLQHWKDNGVDIKKDFETYRINEDILPNIEDSIEGLLNPSYIGKSFKKELETKLKAIGFPKGNHYSKSIKQYLEAIFSLLTYGEKENLDWLEEDIIPHDALKDILVNKVKLTKKNYNKILSIAKQKEAKTVTKTIKVTDYPSEEINYFLVFYSKDDSLGNLLSQVGVRGGFNLYDKENIQHYVLIEKGKDQDFALEHEELEIYWRKQPKYRHLLAWVSQICKHNWKDITHCPFLIEQLEQINQRELKKIVKDDRSQHYKMLRRYIDLTTFKKIKLFEQSVKDYAEYLLREPSKSDNYDLDNLWSKSERIETIAILEKKLTQLLEDKIEEGMSFQYHKVNSKYSIELFAVRLPKMNQQILKKLNTKGPFPYVTENKSKPFILLRVENVKEIEAEPIAYIVLYPTRQGVRIIKSIKAKFTRRKTRKKIVIYKKLESLLKRHIKSQRQNKTTFNKKRFIQLISYLGGYAFPHYYAQFNSNLIAFSKTLNLLLKKDPQLKSRHLEEILISLGYPLNYIHNYYELYTYYQKKNIDIKERYKQLLTKEVPLKAFSQLFKELKQYNCPNLNPRCLEGLLRNLRFPAMYISDGYKAYQYYLNNNVDIEKEYFKLLKEKDDPLEILIILSKKIKKKRLKLNMNVFITMIKWLRFSVSHASHSHTLDKYYLNKKKDKIDINQQFKKLLKKKTLHLLAFKKIFEMLANIHHHYLLKYHNIEGVLRLSGHQVTNIGKAYKTYQYYLDKEIDIANDYQALFKETKDSLKASTILFENLHKKHDIVSLTIHNLQSILKFLGYSIYDTEKSNSFAYLQKINIKESFKKLSQEKRNPLLAFKEIYKTIKQNDQFNFLTLHCLEGILTNLGFKVKHFTTYVQLLNYWTESGNDIIKVISFYKTNFNSKNTASTNQSFIDYLGPKINLFKVPNKKKYPWKIKKYLTRIFNLFINYRGEKKEVPSHMKQPTNLALFQKVKNNYPQRYLTLDILQKILSDIGIKAKLFSTCLQLFNYWKDGDFQGGIDNLKEILTELEIRIEQFIIYIQILDYWKNNGVNIIEKIKSYHEDRDTIPVVSDEIERMINPNYKSKEEKKFIEALQAILEPIGLPRGKNYSLSVKEYLNKIIDLVNYYKNKDDQDINLEALKDIFLDRIKLTKKTQDKILTIAKQKEAKTVTKTIKVTDYPSEEINYFLVFYSKDDSLRNLLSQVGVRGGYNLYDKENTQHYILIEKGDGQNFALEHEELEIYWSKKTKHKHLFAWVSQICKHNWKDVTECYFLVKQLQEAKIDQLKKIHQENRTKHHALIEKYFDITTVNKVKLFEQSIKEYAKLLSKNIDGGINLQLQDPNKKSPHADQTTVDSNLLGLTFSILETKEIRTDN